MARDRRDARISTRATPARRKLPTTSRRWSRRKSGEDEPEEVHKRGGLGGLLASIIPRSTPRKAPEEDVAFEDFVYDDLPVEEPVDATPDLDHPLFAKKGAAKSAPPTDREAINHEVNANQVAPEPIEGGPVMPAPPHGRRRAR